MEKTTAHTSVGTQFPIEQMRCREALKAYQEIGPAGAFGCAVIEDILARAEKAMADGELLEILSVFKEMQDVKL